MVQTISARAQLSWAAHACIIRVARSTRPTVCVAVALVTWDSRWHAARAWDRQESCGSIVQVVSLVHSGTLGSGRLHRRSCTCEAMPPDARRGVGAGARAEAGARARAPAAERRAPTPRDRTTRDGPHSRRR